MKRIMSVVLLIVMVFSLAFITFAKDVSVELQVVGSSTFNTHKPSGWAKKSVETALELGIIDKDKNYNYQAAITREEFCELVYNYISGVLCLEDVGSTVGDYFIADTDSKAVKQLVNRGIVEGKEREEYEPEGQGLHSLVVTDRIVFAPDDTLTREEAAVILDRLFEQTNESFMLITMMIIEYADEEDISDWARYPIQHVAHRGIMYGVGDDKFAPKDTYTIEQAIATVIRIYNIQRPQIEGKQ